MRLTGPIKTKVFNRGAPPDAFLLEMVDWARKAPDSIFEKRKDDFGETDIYTRVAGKLGPWTSSLHRKAAMLEVMRVLAGFESSWDWNCGHDLTNPDVDTPTTIEAGAWQVSGNSRAFGKDLRAIAPRNGYEFQRAMKMDHPLAMEYIARLLRHTIRHNGPVVRGEIDKWSRCDAVGQFEAMLS